MNLSIRNATIADADTLATIRVRTWQQAYQGLLPDDMLAQLNIAEESQRFKTILTGMPPERRFFAAEIHPDPLGTNDPGQAIAGYCICGPTWEDDPEYSAEIYALYVLPPYQGCGVGRALVEHAARWLLNQGHQWMIIYVLRENWPSRRFYEVMGGQAVREKSADVRGSQEIEVGYGYDLAGFKQANSK